MNPAIAGPSDCRVERTDTTSAGPSKNQGGRSILRPVTIESADLLEMSYRLRYQTYCLEQLFLNKDNYADKLEHDDYDSVSVHVGVLNGENHLVGSARLIKPNKAGLPLFRHCTLFPNDTVVSNPANKVIELSRVCIDRHRRRSPGGQSRRSLSDAKREAEKAAAAPDPFAALIKATYQATKRIAGTHWIIAVERSLRRRIGKYGLPFRLAGPVADYHGPVEPHIMSLADLDSVILAHRYPVLDDCLVGLEPEFLPKAH